MNILERWFMKRIIAKEVRQGFGHETNIIGLYDMIATACREEFTEDNLPTLYDFLCDCFEEVDMFKNSQTVQSGLSGLNRFRN